MHLLLLNWFELLAFFVSIITIKKNSNSNFILFVPYLLITVVIELTATYLKNNHHSTIWLYNLYSFIEFPFWLYFFRAVIKSGRTKKILLLLIAFFLLFALADYFIIHRGGFTSDTVIVGAALVIFCSCIYFYQLMQHPDEEVLLKNGVFWISTGCLLYYSGTILFFGLYDYLSSFSNISSELLSLINNNVAILLYICIVIGLIMFRNKIAT